MSEPRFKKFGHYNADILIDYCSENNLKLNLEFDPEKDNFYVMVTQNKGWIQSWIFDDKYDLEALVKELDENRRIYNGPF